LCWTVGLATLDATHFCMGILWADKSAFNKKINNSDF